MTPLALPTSILTSGFVEELERRREEEEAQERELRRLPINGTGEV